MKPAKQKKPNQLDARATRTCQAAMPAANRNEVVDWNLKQIYAVKCEIDVRPGEFLCPGHWSQVDKDLKRMIHNQQEADRVNHLRWASEKWRELAREALNQVWRKSLVGLYTAMMEGRDGTGKVRGAVEVLGAGKAEAEGATPGGSKQVDGEADGIHPEHHTGMGGEGGAARESSGGDSRESSAPVPGANALQAEESLGGGR